MSDSDSEPAGKHRPHTGRRRNDAAHEAILDAAMRLLTTAGGEPVTVDTIAREAGVGKQTIYRWWPTKGAIFLEALTRHARIEVPSPDTGSLPADLEQFLTATFHGANEPATASLLRTLAAEASGNPYVAELLREFTQTRRDALNTILERGQGRGELAADTDLGLMVDQVYGLLWYRLLLGNAPFTPGLAKRLTRTLISGHQ
ncbi:MAG: putative HTH-type transcriptional regulator YdeS [Actinomycetia bacterium]|nr:putative HTH-type transcriptional regulator YdeS [Actinomycetes bacterium]